MDAIKMYEKINVGQTKDKLKGMVPGGELLPKIFDRCVPEGS